MLPVRFLVPLLALATGAMAATQPGSPQAEIDELLAALGDSPCELYRDGRWHEGPAAKDLLARDLQTLGQDVTSAEKFIERVASGSSAEAYQVRCPGEEEQSSAAWFTHQLTLVRKQPVTDPNVYLDKL